MSFLFSLVKTAILTVIVLLLSQVNVQGKRICDHVADITKSSAVQKPIQVLSANFDFTDGKLLRQAPKAKDTSDSHSKPAVNN
jgi:hypothetical protein